MQPTGASPQMLSETVPVCLHVCGALCRGSAATGSLSFFSDGDAHRLQRTYGLPAGVLTECVSRRSQSDVLMQSSVSVTELLLKVNVKCVWTLEERKKEEEKPHRRPLFAHLSFPDDEPWRPELRRNSSTFVLQDEFHSHYPQFKVDANITQFLMTEQSLTELLINLQREVRVDG